MGYGRTECGDQSVTQRPWPIRQLLHRRHHLLGQAARRHHLLLRGSHEETGRARLQAYVSGRRPGAWVENGPDLDLRPRARQRSSISRARRRPTPALRPPLSEYRQLRESHPARAQGKAFRVTSGSAPGYGTGNLKRHGGFHLLIDIPVLIKRVRVWGELLRSIPIARER